MIRAFTMAFYQIGNKSLRRVIWMALIGSIALFVFLWLVVGFVLFKIAIFAFDGFLGFFNTIFEWVINLFGASAVVVISWLLFPSVVSLIVSFFLEDVVRIVEGDHYPHLSEPPSQDMRKLIVITAKFSVLASALNILVLPVYAILFFIAGPFNLFVYYALNGYLIGREFFELVAHRRADPDQVQQLRKAFPGQVYLAGVVIVFMMTIPVVNLIASVIAPIAMVHLVENWRNRHEMAKER